MWFLPFQQLIELMKQLTSALVYIHEKKLVHKRVKPSNIYWSNEYKKLMLDDLSMCQFQD